MDAPDLPAVQPGSPGWYLMAVVLMTAGGILTRLYTMIQKSRRLARQQDREANTEDYAQKKDAFAEARDSLRQSINDLKERATRLEQKNEDQGKELSNVRVQLAGVTAKHEDCERRLLAVERRRNSKGRGRRNRT